MQGQLTRDATGREQISSDPLLPDTLNEDQGP